MIYQALEMLGIAEDFLWAYVGIPVIVVFGLYLTFRSKFVQLRKFPAIFRNFVTAFSGQKEEGSHLHPMQAFFASIGGSLGIGNVIAVAAAIQIGGPGTIVWIWVTAIIGSLIKYSEVYIGISRRRTMEDGTYRGGPMYFLKDAIGKNWPTTVFCLLMCIYSVEIYQFKVVAELSSRAIGVSKVTTALLFFSIIVLVERGGFRRIGRIASVLAPCLVFVYVSMVTYVLVANSSLLPGVIVDIVKSAFSIRAAEGGFIGSTMLMAMSHGVRRGCYSCDIGVGYSSIIHSASATRSAEKQASLLIFEIFMDTFLVCTTSVLLVLVTGTWIEEPNSLLLVQSSLGKYFPYMGVFVPLFLSLLGYGTVTTYFSAGMHTARHWFPVWGGKLFYGYAVLAFMTFVFVDHRQAMSIMSFVGFLLLALNSWGIWKLRHSLSFAVDEKETAGFESQPVVG